MDWYFLENEEQQGPFSGEELLVRAARGAIDGSTLVWRDGLVDWRPLREMREEISSGAEPDESDLAEVGGLLVDEKDKDLVVQRMAEGIDTGAPVRIISTGTGLGGVLSRTWQIYSSQFLILAAVHIIVWFIPDMISSYLDATSFDTGDLGQDVKSSTRFYRFLENFIGIIALGGIIHLARRYEDGANAGVLECLREGFSNWGKVFWTRLLFGLLILAGVLVVIVPTLLVGLAIKGPVLTPILYGVAACTFIPLLIWGAVRTMLAVTHAVLTGESGSDALRESFEMTRGHFWQFFGYSLVVGMILLIPAVAPWGITFIPGLDHWVLDAFIALLVGIVVQFFTVFLYVYYRVLEEEG